MGEEDEAAPVGIDEDVALATLNLLAGIVDPAYAPHPSRPFRIEFPHDHAIGERPGAALPAPRRPHSSDSRSRPPLDPFGTDAKIFLALNLDK